MIQTINFVAKLEVHLRNGQGFTSESTVYYISSEWGGIHEGKAFARMNTVFLKLLLAKKRLSVGFYGNY